MNRRLTYWFICSWLIIAWTGSSPAHAQPKVGTDTGGSVHLPINTDRSLVSWKGTEMWKTGKHEGTLALQAGYLILENGKISGGRFIADMHSIAITDIPEHEPVARKNLRNHLKSEDFFYVDEFPTAEFIITNVEAGNGDSLTVWGNLSIRDVTRPIMFTASREFAPDSSLVLKAIFEINRFDYNISYQGSYWDRMSSILDNSLVDADIWLSVVLVTSSIK